MELGSTTGVPRPTPIDFTAFDWRVERLRLLAEGGSGARCRIFRSWGKPEIRTVGQWSPAIGWLKLG